MAADFLATHPKIKERYEKKLKNDSAFAKNPYEQLNYIYHQTSHYEKAHLRLPVYRVK